jgi:hypothetical protein
MGLGWVRTSKSNDNGNIQSLRLRLRSGLRQRGGRSRGGLRRGAEAPLYLRSKNNSIGCERTVQQQQHRLCKSSATAAAVQRQRQNDNSRYLCGMTNKQWTTAIAKARSMAKVGVRTVCFATVDAKGGSKVRRRSLVAVRQRDDKYSRSNGWGSFMRHNEELWGGVLLDSGWFGCAYMGWRLC